MDRKLYAESKVELTPFIARNYDTIMNSISFGKYDRFIRKAVQDMNIDKEDHILDLGCGTGKNAALMLEYLGPSGHLTGIDLSPDMERQFLAKHSNDNRLEFKKQRIDIPFDAGRKYDKVLVSFVIHGFPHDVRKKILKNAYDHLKPGGQLMILDFSEFDLLNMPWHHRLVFKTVECKYAFDYIERDWKEILNNTGFTDFEEYLYFRKYARLLKTKKISPIKN
ncbi:MAG: class I SAM-dependent methyltransferase [Bacteroidales bacterium]|nr:class I SAM-dependent methyltransferase [Bacteroidales bacterium]